MRGVRLAWSRNRSISGAKKKERKKVAYAAAMLSVLRFAALAGREVSLSLFMSCSGQTGATPKSIQKCRRIIITL